MLVSVSRRVEGLETQRIALLCCNVVLSVQAVILFPFGSIRPQWQRHWDLPPDFLVALQLYFWVVETVASQSDTATGSSRPKEEAPTPQPGKCSPKGPVSSTPEVDAGASIAGAVANSSGASSEPRSRYP